MIPSANRIACGLFGLAALLSPVLCSPSQAVLSPNSVNKDACVHQNLTMNTKDGRHVVMRHGQVSLSNTTATVWSLAKVPDAPSTWFIYTTQPDDTRLYWYNSGDNLQVESSYSATPFTLKFYYEWDHTAPEVVIYTGERCFNIEQSADNRVWMSPKTQCTSVTMEPAAVPQYHSTDLMCHVNPSDPSDSSSDVSTEGAGCTTWQDCPAVKCGFYTRCCLTNAPPHLDPDWDRGWGGNCRCGWAGQEQWCK